MDIKKYEVLLKVIEKGSYVRACKELGYTQSGITHMMNSLEKEIGFPLLLRSNKGVRPTSEGEAILPYIQKLVAVNTEVEDQCNLARRNIKKKVCVGCFPTISCAWMPSLIERFHQQYPHIQVDLVEENGFEQLEEWLNTGMLDVAIISRQPGRDYDWVDLKEDQYKAVLPKDHDLCRYKKIPAAEMMGPDLYMYRSLDGQDIDVVSYFQRLNIPNTAKFTSYSDHTVLYLIEKKLGIGLLPELLLKLNISEHPDLETRPLDPPVIRHLCLAVRSLSSASLHTRRFIECAVEMVKDNIL